MDTPRVKEDVLVTLRRLGLSLVETAHNRLRLVQGELGDELDRLVDLLVRQLLIALTGLLTIQSVGMLLLSVAWDTRWRIPVAASLAVVAALATFIAFRSYNARKQRTREVFETSLEEFEKDRQAMEKIL